MMVMTVVYASSRERARSSTMSRTVADRRFQRRSMTSASSGPRNFSSAFSGRRKRRRSGPRTPRLSRAAAAQGHRGPAPEQPGMALADRLATVCERDVQLDYQMPVTRHVDRSVCFVAALDEAHEGERRQLALGVALLEPRPHRRALRGVLADRQRMQQTQPTRVGDPLQPPRRPPVLLVAGALEERGVAGEEI